MIELKAETTVKGGDKGVEISCKTEGTGEEIVNEVLTAIQGMMHTLKSETPALYMVALKALADCPEILFGENEDSLEGLLMSKAMSGSIIGKDGLN